MNRTEIEIKLNRDRAWLLESFEAMSPEEQVAGVTRSAHDPSSMWSARDHLVHLAGIEGNFNRMIRRYLEGEKNPVGLMTDPSGAPRSREEIMKGVNESNEVWILRFRGASLNEVVALGQKVRAETLALLAELSDAQLAEKLPTAPWADGTLGGVIGVNGDHARGHLNTVKAARAEGAG